MRILVALLIALSVTLGVTVYDLENRPPEVVRIAPAEELPWAIGITLCDQPFALVWTTEPPTWFTPDDDLDAEQIYKMQVIVMAGQYQDLDISGPRCTEST